MHTHAHLYTYTYVHIINQYTCMLTSLLLLLLLYVFPQTPDELFPNFIASKSMDPRISCSSGTSILKLQNYERARLAALLAFLSGNGFDQLCSQSEQPVKYC